MQKADVVNKSENATKLEIHQIFKDETTLEKVHKHLSDINDQITDQDIINIKTEMTFATQLEFERSARNEGFTNEEITPTH
jgi:hypothetical protein